MKDYITILSLTYPSEIIAPKNKLESEGIECFVKDELTVQVHNFYSNAIGGIRLQVREKDFAKAKEILIEYGFLEKEKIESTLWDKVEKSTGNIPLINHLSPPVRFLFLTAIFISIISFSFFYFSFRSSVPQDRGLYTLLSNSRFCTNSIKFKDQIIIFREELEGEPFCDLEIKFLRSGEIRIGNNIKAKWHTYNERLYLEKADTLEEIIQGKYDYKLSGDKITFRSENTNFTAYFLD